jgi:phosphatidate cytidylyltransferase
VRSLVALGGIPLLLAGAFFGGPFFFFLVATASTLALREFYDLAEARGASPDRLLGIVSGILITVPFVQNDTLLGIAGWLAELGLILPLPTFTQLFLILILCFVALAILRELFREKPAPLNNLGATLLGVAYVSLFFACMIGLRFIFQPSEFPLRDVPEFAGNAIAGEVRERIDLWGGLTVCSVFVTVWVCDSAAYFAGRAIGRKKLMVRVSPNKTWEGALAGFLAAVGMFLIARELFLPYLSHGHAVATGCIIGVFGQIGDLAESLLKRDAGVKDSSSLIPGHGGMLDRFDSLLFVSPLLFLYYDFIVFAR